MLGGSFLSQGGKGNLLLIQNWPPHQCFADPALSPQSLARKVGVTTRYIQDLLHETGASFTDRVQVAKPVAPTAAATAICPLWVTSRQHVMV
jgi:hypothetical protein